LVFTGEGAKLSGMLEVAKDHFKLPAFLGLPLGASESPIDKVNDLSFNTAVGLAIWGTQGLSKKPRHGITGGDFGSVNKVVGQIQGWFKSLMP